MGKSYINKLAHSMIGVAGICVKNLNPDLVKREPVEIANVFNGQGMRIRDKLMQMNPGTLGRIATFGLASPEDGNYDTSKTTLSQVYQRDVFGKACLDPAFSGKRLLVIIAYYTIMAEIIDIIKAHFSDH